MAVDEPFGSWRREISVMRPQLWKIERTVSLSIDQGRSPTKTALTSESSDLLGGELAI
jgi:hypothetical protein